VTDPADHSAVGAQAVEWALRDKPFETGALTQHSPVGVDHAACAAALDRLASDEWVRRVDDAWYPGVRALVLGSLDLRTPDTDGYVAAVAAARDHVVAHDGADREAILEALSPAQDHVIGLRGAQMVLIGDPYRPYVWKQVLAPGLRVVPEIEPPEEDGEWTVGEIDAEYGVLPER